MLRQLATTGGEISGRAGAIRLRVDAERGREHDPCCDAGERRIMISRLRGPAQIAHDSSRLGELDDLVDVSAGSTELVQLAV